MNHDELLERIEELKLDVGDSGMNEEYKASYALLAVVELHMPEDRYQNGKDFYCSVCFEEGNPYEQADEVRYPCPTIQAIEKELS